jgi:hypothetical protein
MGEYARYLAVSQLTSYMVKDTQSFRHASVSMIFQIPHDTKKIESKDDFHFLPFPQ